MTDPNFHPEFRPIETKLGPKELEFQARLCGVDPAELVLDLTESVAAHLKEGRKCPLCQKSLPMMARGSSRLNNCNHLKSHEDYYEGLILWLLEPEIQKVFFGD